MAALISLGVTIIAGGVFLLMAVETQLLVRHRPPITTYARALVRRWPGPAIGVSGALVFVVGLLFAHFVMDAYFG